MSQNVVRISFKVMNKPVTNEMCYLLLLGQVDFNYLLAIYLFFLCLYLKQMKQNLILICCSN